MTQTLAAHLSPERGRFVNVALVGALHLGAIYTLLVALDVVPSPVAPPPPATFRIIDQRLSKDLPIPVTGNSPTFREPAALKTPAAPIFDIQEPQGAPLGARPDIPNELGAVVQPIPGPTSPPTGVGTTHTIPPYPPLAVRLSYEGSVRLLISVDQHGIVSTASVETSSGHADLDAAAVSWVTAHWRYQPAMQGGQAVAATTTAVVTFRLKQARF